MFSRRIDQLSDSSVICGRSQLSPMSREASEMESNGPAAFNAEAPVPTALILNCRKRGNLRISKMSPSNSNKADSLKLLFHSLEVSHPKMFAASKPTAQEGEESLSSSSGSKHGRFQKIIPRTGLIR